MLLNFVSVLIFSQRTALGSCLCQQLMSPVTSWSGGNSPVCFLLAHLLGICRDTGLTGAKTGWLIEAKSLPSPLLLRGGGGQGESFSSVSAGVAMCLSMNTAWKSGVSLCCGIWGLSSPPTVIQHTVELPSGPWPHGIFGPLGKLGYPFIIAHFWI